MPIYDDTERERHNAVIGMLREESDRGAVLVGAAFLDDLLQELLAAFFVDPASLSSAKERDRLNGLFQPNGAAGSFSSRITLAYALGLISKRDCDDLNLVREIRNDFAHKLRYASFSDDSIHDRCANLGIVRDISDSGFTHHLDFGTPRRRYIWTVSVLYGRLVEKARTAERRNVPASRRVEMLSKRRLQQGHVQLTCFGRGDETIFIDEEHEASPSFEGDLESVPGFNAEA